MVVAAASLVFALAVVAAAFGALRWQHRAHERQLAAARAETAKLLDREDDLLAKIMHLAERPMPDRKAEVDEGGWQDRVEEMRMQRLRFEEAPESVGDLHAMSDQRAPHFDFDHDQPALADLS